MSTEKERIEKLEKTQQQHEEELLYYRKREAEKSWRNHRRREDFPWTLGIILFFVCVIGGAIFLN